MSVGIELSLKVTHPLKNKPVMSRNGNRAVNVIFIRTSFGDRAKIIIYLHSFNELTNIVSRKFFD